MPSETVRARPLLGTIVVIAARGPRRRAERAIQSAWQAVERVQRLMSYHEPASDVARCNRMAHQKPVRVHAETFRVLKRARRLWRLTGGLFDITGGAVLARAGYLPIPSPLPANPATMADLRLLSGRRVRYRRPLWMDLGGIAKGYAVDQAVAALDRAGIREGVVNAGGDMRYLGKRRASLFIRDPRRVGYAVKWRAGHQAVASSAGTYSRRRIRGVWCTPLVDPRRRGLVDASRGVTVVAPACWAADALTKPVALNPSQTAPALKAMKAKAYWVENGKISPVKTQ